MRLYLFLLFFFSGSSYCYSENHCNDFLLGKSTLITEYGTTNVLKNENVFLIEVTNTDYIFKGYLNPSGKLEFVAFLTASERGVRSHLSGPKLFEQMIEHFGRYRINAISGYWHEGSLNHDLFFKGIEEKLTPKEAALQTWTGKQSARFGYNIVRSVDVWITEATGKRSVRAEFARE